MRAIRPNDVYDIGALTGAIPCCDILITEKMWVDLASRAELHNKHENRVAVAHEMSRRTLDQVLMRDFLPHS